MDLLNNIQYAFKIGMDPFNLLAALIGCLLGTLVGVLPGLGSPTAIALLLPLTYYMTPTSSIIMLSGIYYGANYGGSTTAILVNIPGESSSVVTCLDGYQMARKGRAGPALGISAFGSFIGGTFSLIILMCLAPPLSRMALRFGPPEMFSVMFFGLTIIIYLAKGSMIKSLMMALLGLLFGCIGTDLFRGGIRYTFGIPQLMDGLDLIQVCMGIFGIDEILSILEEGIQKRTIVQTTKLRDLLPTKKDWKESAMPIVRACLMGSSLGTLPGGGPTISSFISYAMEKRFSKHPERFGTGEIAGVAGPETANNAACGAAFIPLLTLGIPTTVVMAVLLGGFMIKGIIPGPFLISKHPEIFWGVVGSMYIGNVMLLALNLPLIGIWVQLLRVPYGILFPLIFLFCLVGSYIVNGNSTDVMIMVTFGVMGYLFKKFEYPAAPLILALILGPLFEKYLGQSLILGEGNPMIFLSRPISATLIIVAIVILVSPFLWKRGKDRRERLSKESGEDFS